MKRNILIISVFLTCIACGKDPVSPENEQVHIPVEDGRMLLLLINESNSNVLVFNYTQENIRVSDPDYDWGANLLDKPLEPGKMDTVYTFTEEEITLLSIYRYELESGISFGSTLIIEQFDDRMDLFITVEPFY